MASDLKGGWVDLQGCARITPEQARSLRKGFAKPGDVLLSHKGTVGRTAIVGEIPDEYLVLTPQVTYYRVLDADVLDPGYLRFYFDSYDFQAIFEAWANSGSTRSYLGITAQRKLPVVVPPIEEQRAIAGVLGAIDEKIHANRELNTTLEATCQALFRSWFVDFDPVAENSEGRRPPHLSPEVANLFPSRLLDTENGPLPEGWVFMPLDRIADFKNGLALQKYRPNPGDPRLPVIKIAQLREGRPGDKEWASTEIDPACVLADGDLVFSWSGTLMVKLWCGGPGALNQHLFKVTSEQFPKWFFQQWTLQHLPDFQGIAADKATTMGHIRRHHLSDALCIVPSPDVLEAAGAVCAPLVEAFIENDLESRTLAALRDALLPRLLSGELRVRDAEELVGGAV